MAQYVVPLQPILSQVVQVQLGTQDCRIYVYQKTTGLYVDLYVNGALIVGGVLALLGLYIVRYSYLPFIGDLFFFDMQGYDAPQWDGIGSRWYLAYTDSP